jgi:hypothetical protein
VLYEDHLDGMSRVTVFMRSHSLLNSLDNGQVVGLRLFFACVDAVMITRPIVVNVTLSGCRVAGTQCTTSEGESDVSLDIISITGEYTRNARPSNDDVDKTTLQRETTEEGRESNGNRKIDAFVRTSVRAPVTRSARRIYSSNPADVLCISRRGLSQVNCTR